MEENIVMHIVSRDLEKDERCNSYLRAGILGGNDISRRLIRGIEEE
jgi:hypothetical protein